MLFIKFIIFNNLVLLKRTISNLWNNYKVYRKWGLLLDKSQIIISAENIKIGSNFGMGPYSQLFAQGKPGDASIVIGDNVAMNFNVMINASSGGKIIIGNDVMIGPHTVMRAANHRFDDLEQPIYKQGHLPGEIIIEDDVWIAANVVLASGAKLGKGCIISAGSVVSTKIPEYSIVAGNPGRVVLNRNNRS